MKTLMSTVKPRSNTVLNTMVVDGWAVTFSTVRMGLDRLQPHPVCSSLYRM